VDLRKRLARLDQLTRAPAPEPQRPGPAAVRGGAAPDRDLTAVLRDDLGLETRETGAGLLWLREDVRPSLRVPAVPLPSLAGILSAGARGARDLAWEDLLFLDTETTGLAGGTGTLPFLIGLGWWRDGCFTTQQLFLTGPGREGPLLAALAEQADRFGAVVTYNGAAFDLPLLRTRARLARRDDPCAGLPSWDLLPAARRLWGRGLPDCRQQTVERSICGRMRGGDDIEGALIPPVYLAYVRDGTAGLLPSVLRHNRRDVDGMALMLAAMAGEVAAIARGPAGAGDAWATAWSRALVCERRRERALAASWARCLGDAAAADLPLAGLLDAVRLLKRVADWRAVESLVQRGLARWPQDVRLNYEAAVLYEHRLGDPQRALLHATVLQDRGRQARLRARLGAT